MMKQRGGVLPHQLVDHAIGHELIGDLDTEQPPRVHRGSCSAARARRLQNPRRSCATPRHSSRAMGMLIASTDEFDAESDQRATNRSRWQWRRWLPTGRRSRDVVRVHSLGRIQFFFGPSSPPEGRSRIGSSPTSLRRSPLTAGCVPVRSAGCSGSTGSVPSSGVNRAHRS
jgi:hypothetical protein